jgi:putative transposase
MSEENEQPQPDHPDWLPRLADGFYRGFSSVHWQMTIDQRKTGWLTPGFHARFRELLLHTMARYHLLCPVYCLMPDHMHLLWIGVTETSDQRKAARFFRRHVNELLDRVLPGTRFQKQAYDHVLRQHEKGGDAVREMAWYILQNPVRAGLVKRTEEWRYLNSMLPGYPTLHPLEEGYWDTFWKIRAARIEGGAAS